MNDVNDSYGLVEKVCDLAEENSINKFFGGKRHFPKASGKVRNGENH